MRAPTSVRYGAHRPAPSSAAATKPHGHRRIVPAGASAGYGEPCHGTLLFAYGANLSPAILQKRGVWPLERAVPAVAPLDAVLSFCHRGGFATVDYAAGATATSNLQQPATSSSPVTHGVDAADPTAAEHLVADAHAACELCSVAQPHGMLYRVSDTQLTNLSKRETGYILAVMPVTPYGAATPVHARVFVSRRMLRLRKPVPPTQRYLDLILSGARSWQLSDAYISQLERVPAARPGGLPAEYFDTPSAVVAGVAVAGAVLAAACLIFWRAGL